MPQLDLINFYYIIITIILCFLFCFVSYQKKVLYSWKKLSYIIEKITTFCKKLLFLSVNFSFYNFFFFKYLKIFSSLLKQKVNNND